jgi:hypothetical protein
MEFGYGPWSIIFASPPSTLWKSQRTCRIEGNTLHIWSEQAKENRSADTSMQERPKIVRGVMVLALSLAFFSGCGYQVAGRGERLPPDVKTVAVPIFTNESPRFRIEQNLAGAVTREFIERTKFKITPNPTHADAVLKGTVKDVRSGVVTFDLNTGRATALQIQVTLDVKLTDSHTQTVLFANPNYVFREEYQISQSTSALFEEDQPALDRLSRDVARTLVTDILENF